MSRSQSMVGALRAEWAATKRLLDRLPAGSVLDRAGLEARLSNIGEQLADEERHAAISRAFVDIVFAGSPVIGSSGVDAQFGAKAIDAYQRAVSAETGVSDGIAFGSRGPLPRDVPRLHVTDVVRGRSFGFRLEEIGQLELHETSRLTHAVDRIEDFLVALQSPDDDVFDEAIEGFDTRVISALTDFMKHVRDARAVFSASTSTREVRFATLAATHFAAERLLQFEKNTDTRTFTGTLWGLLADARKFEFLNDGDSEIWSGKLSRRIRSPEAFLELSGKRVNARIRVTTKARPERTSTSYLLLGVEAEKDSDGLFS